MSYKAFPLSPEYLNLLLENSSQGIVSVNMEGRIIYANKRSYELHGIPEGVNASEWSQYMELFDPQGRTPIPHAELPLFRAARGEKVSDFLVLVKRKDASSILLKYYSEPLFENGKQIGAMVSCEDSSDLEIPLARFNTFFEQSPLSLQILNKEGRILQVNSAYKKLWGLTDEFVNDFLLKQYNLLQDPLLIESGEIHEIRKAFEGEIVNIKEFYYDPTKLGLPARPRWAGGVVYPLKNKDGEVQEIVIIHQDVTDQKIAQLEKEKIFSQLQAIIREMPAGLMVCDKKGNVSLYNEQMNTLVGDQFEAIRTFGIPLRRSSAGELVDLHEITVQGPESTKVLISSAGPIYNSEGQVEASILIATDKTKQKRIESNLSFLAQLKSRIASSIDYDKVLDLLAEGVIPYLADGCMVDLFENNQFKRIITRHGNPEIEKLMLILRSKFPPVLGSPQPAARVVDSGQAELLTNVDSQVVKEHTVSQEHFDLIKAIGIKTHMCIPLIVRGEVIGAISFIGSENQRVDFDEIDFDLAKEVARYASLMIDNAALYKNAQGAVQLRDDFISIASHELRTPITSLGLQVEVLKSLVDSLKVDSDIPEVMIKFLQSTENQLSRLTRLVNDMLDISRIRTGKLSLNLRLTDLKEIIQSVINRFQDQLNKQKIEISFFCNEDVTCMCDSDRIDQVLTNFMTNAIRYGNKQPIHVFLEKVDGKAVIKVKDFGRGIHSLDQERIFNRFERIHTDQDVDGLGLGLYINRQIIDEHNGKLSLESAPGKGSTFMIELNLI